MNEQLPPILGPLLAADAGPMPAAVKTSPSGLILPDLSWTAASFGLVPVPDAWLATAVRAYLTASEYLGVYDRVHGREFSSGGWVDALLRLYPRELYVQVLAKLNRAGRFKPAVVEYQRRFLARLAPGMRQVVTMALAGGVDGQQRALLARQPLLRAMRLVLTAGPPEEDPDERIVNYLAGVDPETAAVMLTHLAADSLGQEQADGEPQLGGAAQSLAIEMVCNQIFNEPHDIGSLLGRTWSLWTRHAARIQREHLDKDPLGLLEEATGLTLAELLAPAFAYWVKMAEDRVDGPVRINAFTLLNLPHETVECFLAKFSTTFEELSVELEMCEHSWQMLPLQTRPLLRIADEVVVLDEQFLWDAVTAGLYWRVSDFVRAKDSDAWEPWSRAYGEMVEALAEEMIKPLAPRLVGGASTFFTEEEIKAAFATKKYTPPNIDAGIDFGDGVVLFEIVGKAMSLATRTGDVAAFKDDVDQAIFKKAKQLDGTAALLLSSPQPAASPVLRPADKLFPIVVCANNFPVNPVTRNIIEARLRAASLLQGPGIQPLAIIDLDDLEAFGSLAKLGERLPEVLTNWMTGQFAKGSFTIYLAAVHGGKPVGRPDVIAASLHDAFEVIRSMLNAVDTDQEPAQQN